MNKETRNLWIGIGIGSVVGLGGGYAAGTLISKKRNQKKIREARRRAYEEGVDDATEECKKWMDDNVVILDADSSAEDIQKALEAQKAACDAGMNEESSDGSEAAERAFKGQTEASEEHISDDAEDSLKDDAIYGEKGPGLPHEMNLPSISRQGEEIVFEAAAGTKLYYPVSIFLNEKGDMLGVTEIRKNLLECEDDIPKLRVIWNAMGWGTYVPEIDGAPTGFDINNWDLDIGGPELDEPEVKVKERETFSKLMDQYIANPNEQPSIISRDEFSDETHLQQEYINWYEGDNQFVDSTDMERPIDPVVLMGVASGEELFAKKKLVPDADEDPDIVHVRNVKMNCVIEVTRFHKSLGSVNDGSAYIHGGSD